MINPDGYQPPSITLTTEQQRTVNDSLRTLQDLAPIMANLQNCGVNCDGYEALRIEMRHRLESVKQHFMPSQEPQVY